MLLATAAATLAVLGLGLRKRGAENATLSRAARISAVLATIDLVTGTHFGMPIAGMLLAIAVAVSLALPQRQKGTATVAPAATTVPAQPAASAASNRELSATDILQDLRAPLTSVLAALQISANDGNPESQSAAGIQLRTYGRQLAMAMADIEDLGVLLRGDINLSQDALHLGELLSSCIDELAPTMSDRELQLRFDLDPSLPPWLQGDPVRVRQLFSRVLQLATLRCSIGPVDVFASSDETNVHIVLLNYHAGVEDADALGMVFVQELTRTLGGLACLRARAQCGSEYHIVLPKVLPESWEIELQLGDAEASQQSQPHAALRVQGQVLLITDNHDHQTLLSKVLNQEGVEATTVAGRDLAMHVLPATQFDLVLLDMQSDGNTGITTAAAIRAQDITTPVVALTSDCSPAFLEECLSAGCNGHLAKPLMPELLRGTLTMYLATAD